MHRARGGEDGGEEGEDTQAPEEQRRHTYQGCGGLWLDTEFGPKYLYNSYMYIAH